MTDETTIRIYDAKAEDYARTFAGDEPARALKIFMSHLPPNARVLDWGCGPGMASWHMKAAGFDPDPVDASAEMVAVAGRKYGVQARKATFADLREQGVYDGVWANFSLLHAPRADLPGHLQAARTALRPEGILHIGMKRGRGETRDRFGRKYTYVTTVELSTLLEGIGFEILKTHEGEEAGLAGTIDPFVLILARRKQGNSKKDEAKGVT